MAPSTHQPSATSSAEEQEAGQQDWAKMFVGFQTCVISVQGVQGCAVLPCRISGWGRSLAQRWPVGRRSPPGRCTLLFQNPHLQVESLPAHHPPPLTTVPDPKSCFQQLPQPRDGAETARREARHAAMAHPTPPGPHCPPPHSPSLQGRSAG